MVRLEPAGTDSRRRSYLGFTHLGSADPATVTDKSEDKGKKRVRGDPQLQKDNVKSDTNRSILL